MKIKKIWVITKYVYDYTGPTKISYDKTYFNEGYSTKQLAIKKLLYKFEKYYKPLNANKILIHTLFNNHNKKNEPHRIEASWFSNDGTKIIKQITEHIIDIPIYSHSSQISIL